MNHAPPPLSRDEPIKSQRYVVVKFNNDTELPPGEFTYHDIARQLPDDAAAVDRAYVFARHLGEKVSPSMQKIIERAESSNPDYRAPNFLNYLRIEVGSEREGESLVECLRSWNIVDYAYLHPGAVEPPAPNVADNPLANEQVYLNPAPIGVDAYYAWDHHGGKGQEQRLADVEWGWYQGHEDLANISFTNIADGYYKRRDHGTNVLGIITAVDNKVDCVGIAHEIDEVVTIGQWRGQDLLVTGPAVKDAMEALDAGDVLLIEAQTSMYGFARIPLEAEPDVFELVKLATLADITVVAAAGNGAQDLDLVVDNDGVPVFDCDSGAIIVAAASLETAPNWQPENHSCVGQRVNCFAQGTSVVTLHTNYWGTESYTTKTFARTSAAAAIVAGAALVIQGVAYHHTGSRLGAGELRSMLANKTPSVNTPPGSAASKIGVMPNLRNLIANLLSLPLEPGRQSKAEPKSSNTYSEFGNSPTLTEEEKTRADKTIYVYLDTSRNPPERVDPIVLGRSKMKWRKESDSPDFDFVGIEFIPKEPFEIKKDTASKINVDNDLTEGDYEYILTVRAEADGQEYDTTEIDPPPGPGDKPVIRN